MNAVAQTLQTGEELADLYRRVLLAPNLNLKMSGKFLQIWPLRTVTKTIALIVIVSTKFCRFLFGKTDHIFTKIFED